MGINETRQPIVTNPQELPLISGGGPSAKRDQLLEKVQTNINEKLGTNKFTGFLNKIFHHKRTVALNSLKNTLKNSSGAKVDCSEIQLVSST